MTQQTTSNNPKPPGWYRDGFDYRDAEDPNRIRYWTGKEWVQRVQVMEAEPVGMSPGGFLALGVVFGLVAGVVLGIGAYRTEAAVTVAGSAMSIVAWVFLAIGVVAKGVQVGRRHP